MGDRANIFISEKQGDPGVWLYSHWGGSELPAVLQTSLRRKWRWDDVAYLARIIFCDMVAGQEHEETGFGISSYPTDGRDRVLIVLCREASVSTGYVAEGATDDTLPEPSGPTWTFEQYCALPDTEIESVWGGLE